MNERLVGDTFLYSLRSRLLAYFSVLFFLVLGTVLLVALHGLPFSGFKGAYHDLTQAALTDLGNLADLKKDFLLTWLAERRGDARRLAESSRVEQLAMALSASGGRGSQTVHSAHQELREEFVRLQETYETYRHIMLVDARTRAVLVSTETSGARLFASGSAFIDQALTPGYREVIDVLHHPGEGNYYLAMARQIHGVDARGERGATVGVLILLMDPNEVIAPLLRQGQQGQGESLEALLLSERQRLMTSPRHPVSQGWLPRPLEYQDNSRLGLAAIKGQEGAGEDVDYRGEPVLAAYRHLRISPDFGWGLVVKRDKAEVHARITEGLRVYLLVSGLCLFAGLGLVFLAAHRLAQPIRALGETARRIEEGQLDARVPVKRRDEVGEAAKTFNAMLDRLASWQNELGAEVSRRTRQLQRVTQLYATLSETNQTIVRVNDQAQLFRDVCRIAVEYGKLELAWVSMANPDSGNLEPFAGYSRSGGPLGGTDIPCAANAGGCSPAEIAIERRRTVVVNDVDSGQCASRWQAAMQPMGLRSTAAFPIYRAGRLLGVFTFCAREAAFFDQALVDLLDEMARDISFAVESIERERRRRETEEALHESEERLHMVVGGAPLVLFAVDAKGAFILSEGKGLADLGLQPGQVVGQSVFELYRDIPEVGESVRRALGGETLTVMLEVEGRSFETTFSPYLASGGGVAGVIGVAFDVTQRRRAEQSLKEAKAFTEQLVETANVMVVGLDSQGRITIFNDTAERVTGYSREELAGCDWFEVLVPRERYPQVWEVFRGIDGGGQYHEVFENPILTKSGEERIISWRNTRMDESYGGLARVVSFGIDVTEQKKAEAQLQRHAFYDPLTDLPNRTLFLDRLEHAIQRLGRAPDFQFAVLFLDLDRFKTVNDSLGHLAGDQLLVAVAGRLENCIRPGDTVSRIGGDEFAILLEGIDSAAEAARIAERIHEALKQPFPVQGHDIFTSVSVGITLGSPAYTQPGDMLRDADTAMYRAKAEGRACYQVFDARMHSSAMARLRLDTELRRALEREELVVYYQPIVSLPMKRVAGFEALIRWLHPQRGMVPPGEFIPLAEETGMIGEIGHYVLRRAAAQIAIWNREHHCEPPLYVSVNLSARQFQQADLLERIEEALAASETDPGCLRLEITESVLMENLDIAGGILVKMVEKNLRLYLDDFGTGYSSLGYLQRLPFDALKIDRSFVSALDSDPQHAGIVPTIIGLAHNLGMGVVAEGVETASQLQRLSELGCENIQGYYYSRPVPAREAGKLITEIRVMGNE